MTSVLIIRGLTLTQHSWIVILGFVKFCVRYGSFGTAEATASVCEMIGIRLLYLSPIYLYIAKKGDNKSVL